MNGTLMWLVSMIFRTGQGEKLEKASPTEWRAGLSIVASFFIFGGLSLPLFDYVNPQSTLATWALVSGIFTFAFFAWFHIVRKLPIVLTIVLGGTAYAIITYLTLG